jgi:hypothetical protein
MSRSWTGKALWMAVPLGNCSSLFVLGQTRKIYAVGRYVVWPQKDGAFSVVPAAELSSIHFRLAIRWICGSLQLSVLKLSDAGYMSALRPSMTTC